MQLNRLLNYYLNFDYLTLEYKYIGIINILSKYIGNLHPLSINKRLCTQFNNMKINNIKRIGRSLLSLTFDSYQQANSFVSSRSSLPKGWISYIPNYKIFRTEIIRNVDKAFSIEDIREGISWPDASINIDYLD